MTTTTSKDVLTRLDSLVTGNVTPTCDEQDEASQSVSDIFAKISRDKRKPDKPVNPPSILKKPDTTETEKKAKRRIR